MLLFLKRSDSGKRLLRIAVEIPVVFEDESGAVEQTQVSAFGHDQMIDEFEVEFFEIFLEGAGGFEVGFRGDADASWVVVSDDDPGTVVLQNCSCDKSRVEVDAVVFAVAPFAAENPVGVVEDDHGEDFVVLIADFSAQIADGCQRIFDEVGRFEGVLL